MSQSGENNSTALVIQWDGGPLEQETISKIKTLLSECGATVILEGSWFGILSLAHNVEISTAAYHGKIACCQNCETFNLHPSAWERAGISPCSYLCNRYKFNRALVDAGAKTD